MLQEQQTKILQQILRCPITNKPLRWLQTSEVDDFNVKIVAAQLLHGSGDLVQKPLQQGLQVEGEQILYPVREGIVCLLPELAIFTKQYLDFKPEQGAAAVKATVKNFYDDVGWQAESGLYRDALDSEDLRSISAAYIAACNDKIRTYLPQTGNILLDVASGPVQYESYVTFSKNFNYRLCADISFKGLLQAKAKLGAHGLYVLCDITNLPIQDNCIDAVVSMHTIYHVPKSQQLIAFQEIYRVIKPDAKAIVIYSWGAASSLMKVFFTPLKLIRAMLYQLKWLKPKPVSQLYFYSYDFHWYQTQLSSQFKIQLASWRSVNVPFLKLFIHEVLLGKHILQFILYLEQKYPHIMGRIGAYPMFIMHK